MMQDNDSTVTFASTQTAQAPDTSKSRGTSLARLPATREELLRARKSKKKSNLIDDVEELHTSLWENDEYRRYLEAVIDEEAVEGRCVADDLEAAEMIRVEAKKRGVERVMNANKWAIKVALGYVMGRFGMRRKDLRK